ncbi:MAG: metal ABC transporter substrate-binding protein [Dehalococcoidales bacterium]|nr:metal ABC transporter substrate-binding protein [Dehalococcoidales bacterium]
MNKTLRVIPAFILIPVLLGLMIFSGCATAEAARLKVVTGSSLLTYIVEQVGGDKLDVINLIPPAQHPGDFNVKPGDIETLSKAGLFLLHGWPGEKYADDFIAAANNPGLTAVRAGVDGNWMIPSVQMTAVEKVAGILAQADSKNAAAYQAAAEAYKGRIQQKETDINARLGQADAAQVNVISSIRQADFLQWAGFNVAATYISPDALTPQAVKDLVDKGRAAGVTLVVNNLQDSADAGKGLAEELNARSINLSNFPGGMDDTETWEKTIDRNLDILLEAVSGQP